jgi:hypothetical protein
MANQLSNDKLSSALVTLAINPVARQQFEARPEAVAALLSLSPEETTALVNRDPVLIQKAILAGRGVNPTTLQTSLTTAASETEIVVVVIL